MGVRRSGSVARLAAARSALDLLCACFRKVDRRRARWWLSRNARVASGTATDEPAPSGSEIDELLDASRIFAEQRSAMLSRR
jgi:hypothetical protein